MNVSRYRGDALLLTADPGVPVRVLPLLRLTRGEVIRQVNLLNAALRNGQVGAMTLAVLSWLWDEVADPVLRALGLDRPRTEEGPWPRIWWCPVGEMAYLPLHAAGHHDASGQLPAPQAAVIDRAISSYTPSVQALLHARRDRRPATEAASSAVIVAMTQTPDAVPLPGAGEEASVIQQLIPGSRLLSGADATYDALAEALPRHRIVHLACHGEVNWRNPAASRLLLHDYATAPFSVAELSSLHLPYADLAYLSACSTAVTSQALADGALHITSAFQIAGFRNVIGTLWPVSDKVAADIAVHFYRDLTRDGTTRPDVTRSAAALHHAVRRARGRYSHLPWLWAGHVHTGA